MVDGDDCCCFVFCADDDVDVAIVCYLSVFRLWGSSELLFVLRLFHRNDER